MERNDEKQEVPNLTTKSRTHTDKLKTFLEKEIKALFGSILDYAEVSMDSEDRYQKLRSKILRIGNDTIRNVQKEVDTCYEVRYVPPYRDVLMNGVVIKQPNSPGKAKE